MRPVIYEIDTWVWLRALSDARGGPVTLANVPGEQLDAIAETGATAVWWMGVWERSPAGILLANQNPSLQAEFRRALPDYVVEDNVGSPYCVRRYRVDEHLGGPEGLAAARRALKARGLGMILDFVPNHVAPDHPWVTEHPEYFVRGDREDLARAPREFFEAGGSVIAHGRDPNYPPWPDVAQLNPFHPGLRQAVADTLAGIAEQSDGVRCDMAMLLLNDVCARTWGARAGDRPPTEYWDDVISATRRRHPDFLFIAEAYWDLEWTLQQHGFDYCYDKRLYDRLLNDDAESVRGHLRADLGYQDKLVRFIENHDEPRAAAVFSPEKERAAALVVATTPGAKLLHEGQLEGRRVRVPVFLGRRPPEAIDQPLREFYGKLSRALARTRLLEGEWQLLTVDGWPDNASNRNVIAYAWEGPGGRALVAVNLSERGSQGRVRLPWPREERGSLRFTDLLSGEVYERDARDVADSGLYVDLPPWRSHLFEVA